MLRLDRWERHLREVFAASFDYGSGDERGHRHVCKPWLGSLDAAQAHVALCMSLEEAT